MTRHNDRRLFATIRGTLETKSAPGFHRGWNLRRRPLGGARGGDRAALWDMEAATTEGYERNVWTFRAVELISGSQSRLPFNLASNFETPDQEIIDDHPIYRVLNVQANPLETGSAFRKRLSAQVLLSKKGAFVEVTNSRAGTLTRVDLLDPSGVELVLSNDGNYIDYFEYTQQNGEVRELAPEKVRWVREPHPLDPFSGVTPLEAAGISIELDQLSRQYNVSFIKNDSRPGGVLAVDTDSMSDAEMDRIERRFKGGGNGVYEAGQMTVVASGAGGVRYVDTTTRPRDMAYGEAALNAKTEILTAFGVGESLLGNASGRTFDNAEQEEYNFWTKPMPPHLSLIAGAFAADVRDEELTPFINTSSVEALEVGQRKKREEARTEVREGLRSINEYRPMNRLDEVNAPQARALWIPPSKAPIPMNEDDAAALLGPETPGGAPTGGEGEVPPGGGAETATTDALTAATVVEEARDGVEEESDTSSGATIPMGEAAFAVEDARMLSQGMPEPGQAAAAVEQARNADSLPPSLVSEVDEAIEESAEEFTAADAVAEALETKAQKVAPPSLEYELPEQHTVTAEAALTAALAALLARQQGVIASRIESPKFRRGTHLWRAGGATDARTGDESLDVAKIVATERWVDEFTETASPLIQSAAIGSAGAFLIALIDARVIDAPDGEDDVDRAAGIITVALSMALLEVLRAAVTDLLEDLTIALDSSARVATNPSEVVETLMGFYAKRADKFTRLLGGDLAHAAVTGGIERAAERLALPLFPRSPIVREWISRRDSRVRPTHIEVDGTVLPVGEKFRVGQSLMAYPQDPAGAPQERYGCRCKCAYSIASGTRLTLPE